MSGMLWYRRPARQWVEALPLGNGRIGAMVFCLSLIHISPFRCSG